MGIEPISEAWGVFYSRTRTASSVSRPVYPPCTLLGRIRCLCRFSLLMKSIAYAFSITLRIPTPPASTIRLSL
jgi:hypothetical protein